MPGGARAALRRRAARLQERLRPTRGYRAARAAVIASRDRRQAVRAVPRAVLRELQRRPASARPSASPAVATAAPVPAAHALPDGVTLRLSTSVPRLLAHDRLSVGLVGTRATARALGAVTHVTPLPPDLGPELLRRIVPDLLLVEAAAGAEPAWGGLGRGAPRRDAALQALVAAAREVGVPVVVVPCDGTALDCAPDHVLAGWRAGVDLSAQGPLGPRAAAGPLDGASAGPHGALRTARLRGAAVVDADEDGELALEAIAAGAPLRVAASLAADLGLAGLPGVAVGDATPERPAAAGVVERLGWLVARGHTADRAADRLAQLVGAAAGGRGLTVAVADDDSVPAALAAAAGGADLVVASWALRGSEPDALGRLVAAATVTGAAVLVGAGDDVAEPFPVVDVTRGGTPLAWSGPALLLAGADGVAGEARGVAGLPAGREAGR